MDKHTFVSNDVEKINILVGDLVAGGFEFTHKWSPVTKHVIIIIAFPTYRESIKTLATKVEISYFLNINF